MINYTPVIYMKKQLRGTLALLCGTSIWGLAFIAQSVGMDLIGPFTFQAVRCGLAVAFLFLITLAFDFKIGIQKSLSKWKNKQLWIAGSVCGCALFVAASLQQVGLIYTDPGKAGFLTAMYIVLVPIMGVFVHRKPGLNAVFSVVLALVGLYLLSFMGVTTINVGDLLLIGCALAFAVQILLIDHFASDLDGLRLNCVQALVVVLLSTPMMLLKESPDIGNILACWLCRNSLHGCGIQPANCRTAGFGANHRLSDYEPGVRICSPGRRVNPAQHHEPPRAVGLRSRFRRSNRLPAPLKAEN